MRERSSWRPAVHLSLLLLFTFVLARTAWLCDDAYITLRTVANFVDGHGLRFNIVERVQAYTHPLWMLCLVPFHALLRDGYFDLLLPAFLCSITAVGLLSVRWSRDLLAATLACALLLSSRAFVEYSTAGLENPLTHLLLALFCLSFTMDRGQGSEPLGGALGRSGGHLRPLIAGLALLNRIDLGLLFLPPLLLELWSWRGDRSRLRAGLRALGIGLLPFFAWELGATFYYGFPYPNTAAAKLGAGVGEGELLRQGLHFLENSIRTDPVTLLTIAASLVGVGWQQARARTVDPLARGLGAGVLFYLCYVVWIGGDFMSGRFLSAPLFASVLLLVRLEAPLIARRALAGIAFATLAIVKLALPGAPLASGPRFGQAREHVVDTFGIADERRWYFPSTGLWVEPKPSRRPGPPFDRTGRAARRTGLRLLPEGAIGLTGYLAGPGLHVVDCFALADPLLARLPMAATDGDYPRFRSEHGLPPSSDGWRIGHFRRNIPRRYLRSLLTGRNEVEDPAIHALYDRVRLITRGPLGSPERLAAIVQANLGLGPRPPRARPPFEPDPLEEIVALEPNAAEVHFRMAEAAYKKRDLETVRRELEAAVAADSLHPRAMRLLIDYLRQSGEGERAARLARRLQDLGPKME